MGLAALIKPEAFSNQAVNADGARSRDTTTGYRLGGVFTALLGVVQVSGLGLGIAGAVRLRKYRQNIGITMAPTPGGMSTGVRLRF